MFVQPLFLGLVLSVLLSAEPGESLSHVSYLYPAGAQQGAQIELTAGGRGLRKVNEVYISGEGVKATVIHTVTNYKQNYGDLIRHQQKKIREKAAEEKRKLTGKKKKKIKSKDALEKEMEMEKLPDHPIFRDLRSRSAEELAILQKNHARANLQKNKHLDELLLVQLTVDPDAAPGMREVRFRTSSGLSNPIRFYIGEKPEVAEVEPNDKKSHNELLHPPFVINGQIMPGDIDVFQFVAKEGQQLLIQAQARALIPYLADAVPGWFQATLSIYDSEGKEVSYADDYRFSPDPVLFYKIPSDGEYTIQIRDSIYRGREDFVYRISVGEDPFLTHIFPLGARQGRSVKTELYGWNLPTKEMELDTNKEAGMVHQLSLAHSNQVLYALDQMPECREVSANDTLKDAQLVKWPVIVNGCVESPGDVDIYKFTARAGEVLIMEVNARRLHSPVDSKIKLMDSSGKMIQWNDDYKQLNVGMLTHHADSFLRVKIPKDGGYYLALDDTQGQGGAEYGYRLRISREKPDFQLMNTPSSVTVRLGCTVPIAVKVVRKDGYDGPIDVILKDAPQGFRLSGATIPAGEDSLRMTLTAPTNCKNTLFQVRFQGRAKVGNELIVRDSIPCSAMTQAFITEHVVPFAETMVFVGGWGEVTELELSKNAKVRIPQGGETTLRVKKSKSEAKLVLKLYQAPEGISLVAKRDTTNALSVSLKADEKIEEGTSGNLMIEVLRQYTLKNGKVRSSSLGVMPAVPFTVTRR